MSGDHGYDPFGFGEPNPAMEAAVAEIEELQGELARLRAENERLRAALRKCEWGGFRMHGPSGTAMSVCPVCCNNATDFHGKHSFGCEIAAALKAEP